MCTSQQTYYRVQLFLHRANYRITGSFHLETRYLYLGTTDQAGSPQAPRRPPLVAQGPGRAVPSAPRSRSLSPRPPAPRSGHLRSPRSPRRRVPPLHSSRPRSPRGHTDGAGQAGGPCGPGEPSAAPHRPPRSPGSCRPQQQAHGRHGWCWQRGGAGGRARSQAGAILRKGRALPLLPAPSCATSAAPGKMAAAAAMAALSRRLRGALRLAGVRPGRAAAGLPG